MKRFLKSSFSIFLTLTIIWGSAVVGLAEIDFSGIKFENPFAVKSKAASSGTCGDNLTWKLDDTGTLTISGTGDMYDYSNYYGGVSPWYGERQLINNIVINSGVTGIGKYAFYGTSLTSITIPDSVTSIGYSAFRSCTSLESLTIGKGVKSIGEYAFYGCTSLKSVYIDDIAAWCEISFARNYDWDYIQDSFGYSNPLYYAENLYVKGKLAKDVVIPDGVTTISDYAFWGYDLTSIRIPVSVTSVGYCAFWCNVGHVYYEGSTEQWKEIFFASGNGNLRKATRTKPQCSKPKLKKVTNMKSGVKITWSKVEFADSYRVYRKVKGGDWKYLDNTKNTSFIDKTAKSGTKYYYSVRAKNNAGISERSSSLSIKRLSFSKASKVSNTSSGVKVTWKKVTGASCYIVYRKTKGGKWDAIKKTSKLYYTDTKAKSGKTYLYTVRACNGSERSYYDTDGLSIRRLRAPKISSATSKREGILLKWNKITGASGYYVYRKVTEGDWKKIASVKGGAKIKYIDETPRKGATYQYRVKAYYGKSTSGYSSSYKIKCKY